MVGLSCMLYENGAPVMKSKGTPVTCGMLTPAANVEVVDNWHTTGMRGTGSSDYRVKDLFRSRALPLQPAPPARREGTLWRRATNFLPKVSGVPLGAARAAIDHVVEMMQTKVEMPGGRPYKNISRIQSAIADAEMKLGAARAYVFSAMDREWARLESHEEPTVRERADAWLSRVNAAQTARDIIRMLYDAVGSGSDLLRTSLLDRALRDAETSASISSRNVKASR